jgi:hypothetical protein
MGNSHKNLLFWNHWANCNQMFVQWSLYGPFQNCVQWSRFSTKMATKLKIEKRGWNLKEIFSSETTEPISTKLGQLQPNFRGMVLGWPPFQKCVRCSRLPTKTATKLKIEKRGMKFKKIFYESTEPISTNLCWNDPWVVPLQNCGVEKYVPWLGPSTKMDPTAELSLT